MTFGIRAYNSDPIDDIQPGREHMPRGLAHRRGDKAGSRHKSSRVLIGGGLLAVAVIAMLIFASLRSAPEGQSNGTSANKPAAAADGRARQVSYEVVNSYAHDPNSFTQGFLWHDGGFYESTGQYGQSKLRRLEFPS